MKSKVSQLQDDKDLSDALSLLVIFHTRALLLVALLRKMVWNLRHRMHLCHPVLNVKARRSVSLAIVNGSFAENEMKFKAFYASSPPCTQYAMQISIALIFRKRALRFVALLRKMSWNSRHSLHLRHPVINMPCKRSIALIFYKRDL